MRISYRSVRRFLSYSVVGGTTFAFDLALLFVLTEFGQVPLSLSTPLAFLIAVSGNYLLSRKFVFRKTARQHPSGYSLFIGMALLGALMITAAVSFLVSYFALSYLIARILVAGFVGVVNYLFNLYINFRVAGTH